MWKKCCDYLMFLLCSAGFGTSWGWNGWLVRLVRLNHGSVFSRSVSNSTVVWCFKNNSLYDYDSQHKACSKEVISLLQHLWNNWQMLLWTAFSWNLLCESLLRRLEEWKQRRSDERLRSKPSGDGRNALIKAICQ